MNGMTLGHRANLPAAPCSRAAEIDFVHAIRPGSVNEVELDEGSPAGQAMRRDFFDRLVPCGGVLGAGAGVWAAASRTSVISVPMSS